LDGIDLAESGWLPDRIVRWGVRRLLVARLAESGAADTEAFLADSRVQPIAPLPELANRQHYEVPAALFQCMLGRHLKYSCGWWPDDVSELDAAEEAMLALSAERADLRDGQRVLELGCGWGSLSLWVAARHPHSRVVAVSNSAPQREFIEAQRRARGIANLEVRTADVNHFEVESGERFDRIVSVEMFEHLRNVDRLLARIAGWLTPGGALFVHHFCHRSYAYPFLAAGPNDWMARHFFSGGMMPCEDWLSRFPRDFSVAQRWRVSGLHYHRTCEAWLANLDARRERVLPVLAQTYGSRFAALWLQRWRLFAIACSELFRYRGGEEWFVSHSRLEAAR
jgi:cyclopropane-fatty-acyl-phospholipid synthase